MDNEVTAYSSFAEVYDLFMSEIPYEAWYECVTAVLEEAGICDGLVLELGCGTGTFTELLAAGGYDMIGVDNSPEMLEAAAQKKELSGADILYLCQDMRAFELYGTVRAVVSVCDSMNYITTEEDLRTVFALVNNYLDPGGIFLFDLKTAYYFREVMGDCVLADNREEASYIWENYYYEEEQMNEYDLTLFLREKNGLYRKQEETHLQRAYEPDEIRRLLAEAGLEFVRAFDADTQGEVRADSERIYIVARECTK
ncbi:methyltransferase domain protein [Marvinbryantia formatexigens DSM 14469]|uniref:Methyltransferase domain protein n=1 Tax=Marvinbryantia formatexigens DSM 14469 TaxID=478749 RepID=C6LM86_9FIRM|nr:class I SAM-dependent methyltransferase [Marvinbryantia formatexigens]EET58264.1 methyltransferase domain protein [Marvinbryantia formatexigens DSM 14469]SDH23026.1 Ubiquinone/menaquinone biosynthesis C-methylase UbiE [Marvinbryantia formatexigens]